MCSLDQVLEIKGLEKRYGKRLALNGLNLSVSRGSVFGLVGSNGAGKTTTLAIVAGLVRENAGTVNVFGGGCHRPEVSAARLSMMPQDADLPADSCVGNLLSFYAELQGMSRVRACEAAIEVLAKVNLSDRINSSVRSLSHGMRRRVVIAQAFLGEPELILLDEPLSGLDPREVANIRETIVRLRGRRTVVISSHNLHEIERMCDHVAFIEDGRTIRQDTLRTITDHHCLMKYKVTHLPDDLECIRTIATGVDLQVADEDGGSVLICRYDDEYYQATEINELVIRSLLDRGAGILSIQQGEGLENAYVRLGKRSEVGK